MSSDPDLTHIGRRALDLAGWADRSIWGWDDRAGTLFAQLWRDRDDEDDEDLDDDDRPDIWITPPAWEATTDRTVLAARIAEATRIPVAAVLKAMTTGA